MSYERNTLRVPVSTYRLQFNKHFRFSDARDIVRYLHDLGISDIYASPYLGAKKGSLHGYDIVDHNMLNPEIGTEEEYDDLVKELRKYGMGQVLDIVPNHMAVGSENALWMDLLENGPGSVFAGFFDVDWDPVKRELKDKVLLPVLGGQYGAALEDQEISLSFQEGAFYVTYYEHRFPVRPLTYLLVLKHDIENLAGRPAEEDPHLTEFLSIITAIEHLPPYTEKDHEKIMERYREKEVIKKRLWALCCEGPGIMEFIDNNVRTFNGTKGEPRSFDLLDSLISEQVYRLSHWRVATEEINYRRFFDINELAAIRVEDPDVFIKTHGLILKLIREGKITGLRVDHPDGLYDPAEYFRRLQRECFMQRTLNEEAVQTLESEKQYEEMLSNDPQYKPFYIVGEKILIKGERMPEDWPIFSTTGYVFLNSVNGVFIDTANAKAFDEIYFRFIRAKLNFTEIIYEKKKQIMYVAMASELNMLAHYLNRISEKNRHTRDFTLYSLRGVIGEVIAFFPVYRTYIRPSGVNDRDRKYIESAVSKAMRRNPAINESVFNFLKDVLLLDCPDYLGDDDRKEWLDFTMRFQQITGPVMAKGVEDTAFYVYNRFVSLNEVGGSPDRFGTLPETFHGQNIERMKYWPHALITTATHDTKRGEDVRARLNVLSEVPDEWRQRLVSWSKINIKKKTVLEGQRLPDRNDEYLLYQTLIGSWPVDRMDRTEYDKFKQRIREYMLKAVREAKVNSSWISLNSVYEDAVMVFIEKLMEPYPGNQFLNDFMPFQKKISHYGMFNSLSQTLLKIASPGVPDFYQGTELWDFSLVDPDNRRPVDYLKRTALLEEIKRREAGNGLQELAKDLLMNKDDGRIKMYLVRRALNYRRVNRELFEEGEYVPLDVEGLLKDHVCAFARKKEDKTIVVAVPRLLTRLVPPGSPPLGEEVWHDTCIVIPFEEREMVYRSVFTGENAAVAGRDGRQVLRLSDVFGNFPAALMEMGG
ncbi:MAG: malto-oligosyltrehalose synthase [Nitrospiraceae bacterium]|nr:MAG: malto-oligosyltrehalose synthase [Nitrospiraceae bacterium]